MDYKLKYLKYKNKYKYLKLLGGALSETKTYTFYKLSYEFTQYYKSIKYEFKDDKIKLTFISKKENKLNFTVTLILSTNEISCIDSRVDSDKHISDYIKLYSLYSLKDFFSKNDLKDYIKDKGFNTFWDVNKDKYNTLINMDEIEATKFDYMWLKEDFKLQYKDDKHIYVPDEFTRELTPEEKEIKNKSLSHRIATTSSQPMATTSSQPMAQSVSESVAHQKRIDESRAYESDDFYFSKEELEKMKDEEKMRKKNR